MIKNKFKIIDNKTQTYLSDGQWFTEDEAIAILTDLVDLVGDYDSRLHMLALCGDFDLHKVIYIDEHGNQVGGDWIISTDYVEYLKDHPKQTAQMMQYYSDK